LRQSTPSPPPPENQSTGRQSPPITENSEHPDGPRDGLPDELPDGPLVEPPDGPSVEPSVKPPVESSVKSLVGQPSFKPPSPENQGRPVEPSVKPLVGQPSFKPPSPENQGRPVEPSVKPLVGQPSFKPPSPENQGRPVERSDGSSTLSAHPSAPPASANQLGDQSFKPPRPSAPLTSVSQPMGSSVGQSMGQLKGQLTRLAKFTKTAIHVRCGIGWIRGSLLNGTGQWLLNNRADGTVLSPFKVVSVSDQKVLPTW
jgi:hypothetical protein